MLRGEAGIGKTALLQYCARQASGCRVARITGVQSELEFPFAALEQLCGPFVDHPPNLPEPQANALRVAFGRASGSAPDRFMVGLAVLGLLAEVAEARPLVCLIDDAQWLDEPTRQVLAFVARRLQVEAVALVFAVRETGERELLPGLPSLCLEGLADEDARALLTSAVSGRLDERVRDRLVAETRGNPLALLELPKGMSPSELAGGFADPSADPLSGQLQSSYLGRVRALPEPTQRLMLLAAADPTGDARLLWRAARALDLGRQAALPAEHDDLLWIGDRVRFRHPLVRAAVYAARSQEDRAAAHQALAEATDSQADPIRRVWHMAAAANEPNEVVATELEQMSGAAQSRGGLAAAAAFLERSLALTTAPDRIADRALAAATAHLQAGALDAARGLAAVAAAAPLNDLQRARVELLTGQIEAASRPTSEASVRLLQAAKRLEALDVPLARETYLQAWWPAILAGRFAAPGGTLVDVCRAALAAPWPAVPRPCDHLLDGIAKVVVKGRLAAEPGLRSTVDLFMTNQVSEDDWIKWGRLATTTAYIIWDFPSWAELGTRQIARARESGALSTLVLALNVQATMNALRGDLEAAEACVAEQYAVKEVTGIRLASYGALILAGYRGHPAALAAITEEAVAPEDGFSLESAALATAILNNGLRRHAEALDAAAEVHASRSFFPQQALPELVEAAVRTRRLDVARRAMAQLSDMVVVEGSDWARGIQARCRALLSDDEHPERRYLEAIQCLGRTPLRIETGRAHLLYGEWLRRNHQAGAARTELRRAHDVFIAAGADAFAERARTELVATGEKVRRRDAAASHDLTPQELHIARLARDGHSNAEIGAQLFLSTRTVEWHLRKVFTKLEVASRRALRDVLPAGLPR